MTNLTIVNFSHPLTPEQVAQVESLAGLSVDAVIDVPTAIDLQADVGSQVTGLVDGVGLSPQEWQTRPLLVNPPGLSLAACLVLAEIHGRSGHFPAILAIRRADGPVTRFEVASIISLQEHREAARGRR